MLRLYTIFISLLILTGSAPGQAHPKAIIFDSDMGPDYDDVGAIAMLHAFADSGKIKILATIASTRYEGVAAVFNVFNTYFNRPEIPIGLPGKNGSTLKDRQHWTDSILLHYPHTIKNNDEVPDAVKVYRKTLASQPDASVTIVTTGFLTNLAGLLQSSPDRFSRLNGLDLVRKKVKELVCMAGRFPQGNEFNVRIDAPASRIVFEQWPGRVIFSGFEIGYRIHAGLPLIRNTGIQQSPVKDVFSISIPLDPEDSLGRMSWDETAVLVAVEGHRPWYTLVNGNMVVNPDGSNGWKTDPPSQAYLVETVPPAEVERIINKLIMHQPIREKQPAR